MRYFRIVDAAATAAALTFLFCGRCGLFIRSNRTVSYGLIVRYHCHHAIMPSIVVVFYCLHENE